MSPNDFKDYVINYSLEKKNLVLTHQIEHAGYGAILSRLMTGFNLSIATNSNYHFSIISNYKIEELFRIEVKYEPDFDQKIIVWDFLQHTWHQDSQIRGEHQFPSCQLKTEIILNRHQWCSVIAKILFGNPTQILSEIIQQTKKKIKWDETKLSVGLHVRRGDKNTENPYIPIEVYVNSIKKIIYEKDEKNFQIFLTTDSNHTYYELTKFFDEKMIVYDFSEERYDNYNAGMVINQPNLQIQESLTCAKNICLLGQCDYVVGMSTSQFTWLGGLLAVYKSNLDTNVHIMIDPFTNHRGHWATSYGFCGYEY